MPKVTVTEEPDDDHDDDDDMSRPDTGEVSATLDTAQPAPGPEPSIEGLLKNFMGGGNTAWDDLDNSHLSSLVKKDQERRMKAMKAEANRFRRVFIENEDGRALLELFLNQTLRSCNWPVFAAPTPELFMVQGVYREAQCSWVAAIMEAIAFSYGQDVKPRSEA